jgi:hypothetical protein
LTAIFNTPQATTLHSILSAAPAGEPLGETYLLGTTWYDYQHNGTIGRMISMTPGGGLHFCWTNARDSLAVNRHVFYNYLDPVNGFIYPGLGYQLDQGYRAGYTTLSHLGGGEEIIAYHQMQGSGDVWNIQIRYDFIEGFGIFQTSDIDNPSWGVLNWPKVTVCDQNYVHIVATENTSSIDERFAYCRSEDEGSLFTPWEVIDTLMTISPEIAASPVSDKVGIAYTKNISTSIDWYTWSSIYHFFNNDVILIESDDGVSWDFSDRQNITRIIDPDSSRYPDSTWAEGDTLRPFCDVSLLYDQEDFAHIAFTTRGVWKYGPVFGPYPHDSCGVYVTHDASMIWYWSEEHDTLTRVADGWYNVADPDQHFAERRGAGTNRSAVDRPCLSQDPETGYLYCIYVRCTQGDTSGGESPSRGWANGEIYCSVSTDGGLNWSEGTNLTNTPSPNCTPGNCFDEDYPSQTLVVNDTLHIIYVEDKDAGGVVQTAPQEGIWTENPVIYQKVPADLVPPGPPYVFNYYFHVGPVGATKVEQPLQISGVVPETFVLHQNYPNPFNAYTEIRYQIPEAGHVTLMIFNTLGQEVRSLMDGRQEAGEYRAMWDGWDAGGYEVASGLYFCRLRAGEFSKTIKMVLAK